MGDLVSDGLLRKLRRHLADGRACTTAELARALGVSARHVRRALDALPAGGARVVEERDGRARRYRLDGLDLAVPPRPVPLSERELRAVLAVVGDGAGLGPLGPAAVAAVRKLVEAFGLDVYAFDPEDLVGQIVVARPRARPVEPVLFDAVAEAVQARQALGVDLAGRPGRWRFEPYALALVDGGWVALGREPARGVLVRVPLEDVRAAAPEPAFFDPPAAFDAVAALATAEPIDAAERLAMDPSASESIAAPRMAPARFDLDELPRATLPPAPAPAAAPPPPARRARLPWPLRREPPPAPAAVRDVRPPWPRAVVFVAGRP